MKTEAQILANTFDRVRNYTRFYTSKLKDQDPYRIFSLADQSLNSLYWLNAHLTWAEDMLILGGCYGTRCDIAWLEGFGLGTNPADAQGPDFKEVLDTQKMVHEKVLAHFAQISDADLDRENLYGFSFGGNNDIRGMLNHAIAHEGVHAGHISWLCKLYGVKVI
jgi:hypothetical protein